MKRPTLIGGTVALETGLLVVVQMRGGGFVGANGHDLLSYDGESLAPQS
jgi:hypothetical protein